MHGQKESSSRNFLTSLLKMFVRQMKENEVGSHERNVRTDDQVKL